MAKTVLSDIHEKVREYTKCLHRLLSPEGVNEAPADEANLGGAVWTRSGFGGLAQPLLHLVAAAGLHPVPGRIDCALSVSRLTDERRQSNDVSRTCILQCRQDCQRCSGRPARSASPSLSQSAMRARE